MVRQNILQRKAFSGPACGIPFFQANVIFLYSLEISENQTFSMFLGGIEREHLPEMDNRKYLKREN